MPKCIFFLQLVIHESMPFMNPSYECRKFEGRQDLDMPIVSRSGDPAHYFFLKCYKRQKFSAIKPKNDSNLKKLRKVAP